MAEISGADALVRCLIEEGVRYVFGIPGDQTNPITDAIHRFGREAGLDFVMTRHEQAAAHMADAWARVTGEPGVCLGTVGPGVADLVPGVYPAWADSVPMVVLGAQNQTWRIYPEHGSMQSLDQIGLMTPITKWRALVADAYEILLHFDALAALVRIFSFVAEQGIALGDLVDEVPAFFLSRREVPVSWEDKGKVIRRLIEEKPPQQLELIDGVKVFHPNGWALILPDPEEPVCRVFSEGASMEIAESLTEFYSRKIREMLGE